MRHLPRDPLPYCHCKWLRNHRVGKRTPRFWARGIVMILVGKPSQKVGCANGLSLSIFQDVFVQTIDAHDADVINQPLLDPFLPHRQATSTTAGCFIKLQQLEVGRSSSPDLRSLVALTSLSSEARSPYPFKFKVAPFPYRSSG